MGERLAGKASATNTRLQLTAAQHEIWMAQELDPQSAVYHVGEYLELDGPIDPLVVEHATRRVVEEAEAIRARFVEVDGNVYQYIEDYRDWEFPIVDFSN